MADQHYGLSRGQNQSWQATAMSPVPDVDVRINFDNGITRHEAVAALDVIKQAVLEDKWPPVDPSVPSSGSPFQDKAAWLRARAKAMAPILERLNADCHTYNTSQGVAGLQAACDAARTAGKPLKLVGSTPLDLSALGAPWRPKPNNTTGHLAIFSDGEVVIRGNQRVELATDLALYNLRFENEIDGLLFPVVNTTQRNITVMGCQFYPADRKRVLYATGSAFVQNLLFRFNEIGPSTYTAYTFTVILSEFSDNWSVKDNIFDRHFFRVGGYRNSYYRNYIGRGRTGITGMFDHASDATRLYPSLQQFVGDIIEGNVFDRVAEEAVSYDVQANSATTHSVLTLATIQAISGSATSSPTLQCSYDGVSDITRWAPAPNRFVQFLTGPCAGMYAQIWSLAAADADTVNMVVRGLGVGVPALKPRVPGSTGRFLGDLLTGELAQEDFTSALNGSVVAVCDLAIGAQIRNNIFLCHPYYPPGQAGLTLWGSTVGFEISGNRFIDLAEGTADHQAIKCTTVSGIAAKASGAGNPNWGATQINAKNLAQFPVSHGRIYNNDCGGLWLTLENQGYSASADFLHGPYKIEVFGNINCRGGGPRVRNWRGNGGEEYSPATPVYDTSSTWIYNNS